MKIKILLSFVVVSFLIGCGEGYEYAFIYNSEYVKTHEYKKTNDGCVYIDKSDSTSHVNITICGDYVKVELK